MKADVIIVGGGPVGLALAVALARYGVRCVVIEKRLEPTLPAESRAIVWMPKGLEFLDWLGMLEVFESHAVKRSAHEFRHRGKILLTLDFKLANSLFQYSLNLPQHLSEALLEAEARKHPELITLCRGHELVALEQSETTVTAIIENHVSKARYQLTAPLLAGCDGAKSTVRQLLGIPLVWSDYGTFSAVADVEARLPTENGDVSWIELNPERPYGLFRFHPDKWRLIYRINRDETREKATTPAFVERLIRNHFPQIGAYKLLWASAFRLGQGQSGAYFKGNVVLAGDAAHPMGPSAGAGMMVGMLGVWRLAWRLRDILAQNKPAAGSYLGAYEREQREGARAIQKANAATFSQIALTSRWKAAIRNVGLRLISGSRFVQRRMVAADTLTNQSIHGNP